MLVCRYMVTCPKWPECRHGVMGFWVPLHYNNELHWRFRNNLSEHDLPNQIARLNRMHREISEIDDLLHVANGIDPIFRYRRLWTEDRRKRVAPVAVSVLRVVRDLQKVLPDERLAL